MTTFEIAPIAQIDPAVILDLETEGFTHALLRNGRNGRVICWGMYASEENAKRAMRRAISRSIATP